MEKPHLSSKKFVGFLVVEIGLIGLMGMMIWLQEIDKVGENIAFMVLAATTGFLAVGFILGQAYVDKYVRVAQIMAGKGSEPEKEND